MKDYMLQELSSGHKQKILESWTRYLKQLFPVIEQVAQDWETERKMSPTIAPESTSKKQCRTGQGNPTGLRSLTELRQTLDSGMSRLEISEQNTEEGNILERVLEICRGILVRLNACQCTWAYLGGNSLSPRNEITEISRQSSSWIWIRLGIVCCSHRPRNAWGIGLHVHKGHAK